MKQKLAQYLAAAMATCLPLLPAFAQESDEASDSPIFDLDQMRISASPIFHSQQESIELQRKSEALVNVIASDAIGRFPDQNAAAALARLPAVAVQRDQGQERFIQVRGAPARWTTVSFDGINVLGAEERIFRFDSIPAAIIDTVEVYKTLTPDMPAESIAGRVNIKTNSGMDKEALEVHGELGYGYMELGGGIQRRGSIGLLKGGKNWGLSLSASHFRIDQTTDNREFAWNDAGYYDQVDFRSYKVQRENNSASMKLEYAPDANTHLYLSSIYAEFVDHEQRNQYILLLDSALAGTQTADSGSLTGVPIRGMLEYGRYFNSTWTNTLGGSHSWQNDWNADWKINYTQTESSNNLPILMQMQTDPTTFYSLDYDATNVDTPTISLYETTFDAETGAPARGSALSAIDQTAFGMDLLMPIEMGTTTDSYSYAADFEKEWGNGDNPSVLKFGFQFDDRHASGNTLSDYSMVYLSPLANAVGIDWDSGSYVTEDAWESDFVLGFGANYVDNPAMAEGLQSVLDQLATYGLYDPSENTNPSDQIDIKEKIYAAYLMNTWELGDNQVVAGLRIEHAKIASSGYLEVDDSLFASSVDQDFTNLFPSIHFNRDISDKLKLRIAGVTGIGRPDFGQMRMGAVISDTDESITGGNPFLDPETTYGFDTSLEWYFDNGALLSAGSFYRHVEDVLFDYTTTVTDDRFDSDDVDRTGYDYVTTLNGNSGYLSGLEFSYLQRWKNLPDFLDGLGMQINVALLDGQFKTSDGRDAPFPGTSDTVVNSSLFYENYGFSVRLSYQWRSDWVDDISFENTGDIYWAATDRVDLSIRYKLTDNLSLYLDANNLNDERGIRYEGDRSHPIEVEGFGRRYLFGIRGKF